MKYWQYVLIRSRKILAGGLKRSFTGSSLIILIVNNHREDVDFEVFQTGNHAILASMFAIMALVVFTVSLAKQPDLNSNSSKETENTTVADI